MSTWPQPGVPPAAPAGGCKKDNHNTKAVRPHRPESSQPASWKVGAVQGGPFHSITPKAACARGRSLPWLRRCLRGPGACLAPGGAFPTPSMRTPGSDGR